MKLFLILTFFYLKFEFINQYLDFRLIISYLCFCIIGISAFTAWYCLCCNDQFCI